MPNYLTRQDEYNFGSDVLDMSQRAALTAVSPLLDQLADQNAKLQRQLAKEARRRLDEQVEAAVPDFREIDRNPRWHRWLLGIDELAGRVRQTLLNDAIAKGNSTGVREFFERFRREDAGTSPQISNRSSGQQIYTPKMIGQLYEAHRKGQYSEADWNRIENDIFAAQREGRVQGSPYLTK